MMNRCYNPNAKDYLHGIKVAEAWHDFAVFLADLGPKPDSGCVLRRQDETRDFAPGNVVWWRRHGKTKSRVYQIWKGMLARTGHMGAATLRNEKFLRGYFDKGIDLYPEWESFEAFYADMGDPPTNEHSLDRVDNSRGYSPDNCRWALRTQQARNRSDNRMLTYRGKTQCVAAWCEEIGISQVTVHARLKLGWTDAEKILSAESFSPNRGRAIQQLTLDGTAVATHANVKAASQATGVSTAAIAKCLCGGNRSSGGFLWRYV